MSEWQKKYHWVRTWGAETGIDGKKHDDWMALDGEEYAGRIRLEIAGPMDGQWHWAGSYPADWKGSPIMPNAGYAKTATEAARKVEDYWYEIKATRKQKTRPPKRPG